MYYNKDGLWSAKSRLACNWSTSYVTVRIRLWFHIRLVSRSGKKVTFKFVFEFSKFRFYSMMMKIPLLPCLFFQSISFIKRNKCRLGRCVKDRWCWRVYGNWKVTKALLFRFYLLLIYYWTIYSPQLTKTLQFYIMTSNFFKIVHHQESAPVVIRLGLINYS